MAEEAGQFYEKVQVKRTDRDLSMDDPEAGRCVSNIIRSIKRMPYWPDKWESRLI